MTLRTLSKSTARGRRYLPRFFFALLVAGLSSCAIKPSRNISEPIQLGPSGGNNFSLVRAHQSAVLLFDPGDFKVVQIAATNLAEDIERVTGIKPAAIPSGAATHIAHNAVLIGTMGHSKLIDRLVADKKLDLTAIRGKWESYLITTVKNPLPGIELGLVITGSDRRGTAFGVFTLSEAIGVSPWYWWADVTPRHRDSLVLSVDRLIHGPPSVKYRGVFINDEDWSLQPWAAKTFEPETGDIGPKTYAKFFELILRLKGNYIWPAMHPCTKAFNLFPANKQVADDYAIVMGSSHCEQMLRNNVTEYSEKNLGTWNYEQNRDGILNYWKQRLEENSQFENVYTIGMRGIHDGAMPGGGTLQEKTARLQRVINDQRELISKTVNPDAAKVPQIFCPYKEVLPLYQNGLNVPDDVTLVWPDDNYGYIRQLSNPAEQKRSGGSGVYYHASYWGNPADYLWLGTTPPSLISEEMTKAYDWKARDLWILNIGGLKKTEISMDFFLRLAWDIHSATPSPNKKDLVPTAFDQKEVLRQFAAREFGAAHAGIIAGMLDEFYRLNLAGKPEFLHSRRVRFSYDAYDEAPDRLARFAQLVKDTDALYERIDARLKDAFFELVVYPVRGAALRNEAFLHAQRSEELQAQNPTRAENEAALSRRAIQEIEGLTRYYNEFVAGGKWKRVVSANPHHLPMPSLPPGSVAANASTYHPPHIENRDSKKWIGRDGVVSIPADSPTRVENRGRQRWQIIGGLSRSASHNSITLWPANQPSIATNKISEAPMLEYDFTLASKAGTNAEIILHALPTLPADGKNDLRYAVAVDNETPRVVSIAAAGEKGEPWSSNVLRAAAFGKSQHRVLDSGPHTLHLWSLDPGLVVEKIVVNLGGLKPSLQGPPETGGE